jgi:hypothetical protein
MVNKKSLILIALATFCLTLSLFMIKPTRSQTSTKQYDPWLDTNGDGTIDIYDAINVAGLFGTSGDPTKNVNITNWPGLTNVNVTNWPSPNSEYDVLHWTVNMSLSSPAASYLRLPAGYCGGYSRLSILAEPNGLERFSDGVFRFTIWVDSVSWGVDQYMAAITGEKGNFSLVVDHYANGGYGVPLPAPSIVENKGPYLQLVIGANSTQSVSWGVFDIYAYLRND